ncbi:UNVERIFIED_CONTAM: hypothetical protein HDU68_008940 [Siphonaria sp. JEL0065]|nr:hypothetical protein HDU68_008940 [Siphonaria sp. JEL0065]
MSRFQMDKASLLPFSVIKTTSSSLNSADVIERPASGGASSRSASLKISNGREYTKLESISSDKSFSIDCKKASLRSFSVTKGSLREVVFAVGFYITTAIVMVMVNKAVLNAVPLPITFLWVQILVAVILLYASSLFGIFKLPLLSLKTITSMLPLILINITGLTLNTLCLQYVDASFYQVARALVLPFTVGLSKLLLKQNITASVLLSCSIVFAGFLAGTLFEGGSTTGIVVSVSGTVLGVASSVSTAIHAIVIKTSLGLVNGNTVDLVFYNNVISLGMLVPVLLVSGEISSFMDILAFGWYGQLREGSTLTNEEASNQLFALVVGGFVTGIFGFLINVAGFFQIKVTSPLTHMISSAFRGVLQTLLAVLLFNDVISVSRIISITFILTGSCFYVWIKSQEAAKTNTSEICDAFIKAVVKILVQPIAIPLRGIRTAVKKVLHG